MALFGNTFGRCTQIKVSSVVHSYMISCIMYSTVGRSISDLSSHTYLSASCHSIYIWCISCILAMDLPTVLYIIYIIIYY